MVMADLTKHKVFVSYYHKDDESYRKKFEEYFGHLFINKSVRPGDIDDDNSAGYIKRLIQQGYLSDTSVLVVLIGPNSWGRKHIDWEISAALSKKVGGYSGLLGVCLPNHPAYGKKEWESNTVPPRFVSNVNSGYAKFIDWTTKEDVIVNYIEDAFTARLSRSDKIDNSLPQFERNRSE
jgi:hypothetical protein